MNLRRFLSALSAVSVLSASLFGQTLPIFNSRITGTAEVKSGGEIEIESGATLDVQSGATVSFGDPLSLANGGLGVALTDPGADRLTFWDDSEGEIGWLTIGSGLTLSGTTLSAESEVGFANPMEAAGDLIIGGESGAAAKLAIGTTGQVLTVVDGAPAWDDAAAGAALPAEPTEGDLAYYDGEAWVSLAIGTNGQVLVVDTGAPAWDDAPTSGFSNPMTTAEDLIVGGTDGAAERLGVGSEGQVLKVVSGAVAWGTDSTGSGSLPGTPTEGDLAYYDGEDWVSLAIGTAAQVLTVNSGATAPEWDDLPTDVGFENPMTTAGDLIVGGESGAAERLAIGTDGQVLKVSSGSITWGSTEAGGNVVGPGSGAVDDDFTWTESGDTAGIIYFIGSNYNSTTYSNPHTSGRVTVVRSSDGNGTAAELVDRAPNNTHTSNTPNSWAAIDFGSGRSVVVSSYTLRSRSFTNSAMRNWKLQGSNNVADNSTVSLAAATWTDIDERNNDTSMSAASGSVWAKYDVSGTPEAYRWLRVLQTGTNSNGDNYLHLAEWEFYGTLNYISEGSTAGAIVVWDSTDGFTVRDSVTSTVDSVDGISTPGMTIGSGTKVSKILSATGSLNYSSISAGAEATATISVTGAVTTGTPAVSLGFSAAFEDGIVVKQAWVSGSNTVSVRVRNVSDSPIDPASVTVRATVIYF